MAKLKKAKDAEAKNHELYCWVHDIPFKRRTLYSCNCPESKEYKENFDKNRKGINQTWNSWGP